MADAGWFWSAPPPEAPLVKPRRSRAEFADNPSYQTYRNERRAQQKAQNEKSRPRRDRRDRARPAQARQQAARLEQAAVATTAAANADASPASANAASDLPTTVHAAGAAASTWCAAAHSSTTAIVAAAVVAAGSSTTSTIADSTATASAAGTAIVVATPCTIPPPSTTSAGATTTSAANATTIAACAIVSSAASATNHRKPSPPPPTLDSEPDFRQSICVQLLMEELERSRPDRVDSVPRDQAADALAKHGGGVYAIDDALSWLLRESLRCPNVRFHPDDESQRWFLRERRSFSDYIRDVMDGQHERTRAGKLGLRCPPQLLVLAAKLRNAATDLQLRLRASVDAGSVERHVELLKRQIPTNRELRECLYEELYVFPFMSDDDRATTSLFRTAASSRQARAFFSPRLITGQQSLFDDSLLIRAATTPPSTMWDCICGSTAPTVTVAAATLALHQARCRCVECAHDSMRGPLKRGPHCRAIRELALRSALVPTVLQQLAYYDMDCELYRSALTAWWRDGLPFVESFEAHQLTFTNLYEAAKACGRRAVEAHAIFESAAYEITSTSIARGATASHRLLSMPEVLERLSRVEASPHADTYRVMPWTACATV